MDDIILETDRLRLRNWRDEDIEPFMQYLNTPKVTRWLGGVQTREKFLEAVERIRGYDRDFGHTFWRLSSGSPTTPCWVFAD